MESKNIYTNLSPLDHRYYLSNKDLFDNLALYFSEESSIKYCIKAESALLKCHIQNFLSSNPVFYEAVEQLEKTINSAEVYAEEEKTQHNIRALVNVIKQKLPVDLHPFPSVTSTT